MAFVLPIWPWPYGHGHVAQDDRGPRSCEPPPGEAAEPIVTRVFESIDRSAAGPRYDDITLLVPKKLI